MPATHTGRTSAEKRDEVVRIAERQLRTAGFEGLSVSAIARELNCAPNAIYWYFPSRDELFVRTLEAMLREIVARRPRSTSVRTRVAWYVDQFAELALLLPAVRARAASTPAAAAFDAALSRALSAMLVNGLSELGVRDQLTLKVDVLRAAIEGTYVQQLPPTRRRRVVLHALDCLTAL